MPTESSFPSGPGRDEQARAKQRARARAAKHSQQQRVLVLMVAAVVVIAAGFAASRSSTDEEEGTSASSDAKDASGAREVAAGGNAASESTTTTFAPPVTLEPLADEPGIAPVITRVETDDPVVFLTIDDGLTRAPDGLAAFKEMGIPASLFLLNEPIQAEPDYFDAMPGTLVEGHTQTHSDLTNLSEEAQRQEICGNADVIEQAFDRRPVLFRPPFGNYNEATRRAAADCGMRAVVLWQENVNWDVIGFREEQRFRPGDIILMHFRPQFVEELNVISQAVEEAGLRFALLEDYLVPEATLANDR